MFTPQIRSLDDLAVAYFGCTQVAEDYLMRDGRMTTIAVVFPRRGEAFARTISGPDDVVRARTPHALVLKAIAEDAVAAVAAFESWTAGGRLEPRLLPRDGDRRCECLTVLAQMLHPTTGELVRYSGSRSIQRGLNGWVSLSGDWTPCATAAASWDDLDFLPRRRPTAAERAAARAELEPLEKQALEDERLAEAG